MRTWDDYKNFIRETDLEAGRDLDEIEENSRIISAMIRRRNELGLSQRELAAECGIPQSSVARIESQTCMPRLDTLLKILGCLGLKLSVTMKGGTRF